MNLFTRILFPACTPRVQPSVATSKDAVLPTSVNTVLVPPRPTATIPALDSPPLTQSTERPYGFEIFVINDNAHIDIVAVHGLDGHRVDSWTANNTLWLRDSDFLPKLIPDARVLSWGYDGRTHGNTPMSCQTINDHAIALITDLSAFRRVTNTVGRPIIFIAHGVGGTTIKDAGYHSSPPPITNEQALDLH